MYTHLFCRPCPRLQVFWLLCLLLGFGLSAEARNLEPVAVEPVQDGQSPWGTPPPSGANREAPAALPAPPPAPPHHAAPNPGEPSLGEILAAVESIKRQPVSQPFEYGLLIPIIAVLLIFGAPFLCIILLAGMHYRARARRESQRIEAISRLLDAGRDIPVELLSEGTALEPRRNLRKGLTNLGVGTGLLIFLTVFLGAGIGAVGYIVIGLGLAQLAVWRWVDSQQAPAASQIPGDRQG